MSDQPNIIRAKSTRGRLDPNSLDAPREAKRRRGGQRGNKNASRILRPRAVLARGVRHDNFAKESQ